MENKKIILNEQEAKKMINLLNALSKKSNSIYLVENSENIVKILKKKLKEKSE